MLGELQVSNFFFRKKKMRKRKPETHTTKGIMNEKEYDLVPRL